MSGTLVVDLSGVQCDIRDFPDGPVEATIKSAKYDISERSGQPMIVVQFEIFHPEVGSSEIRDFLVASFPRKIKGFWQALNNYSVEEMKEQANVEIDPLTLEGAQLILVLGMREKQDKEGNKVMRKDIVAPWYYPAERTDLLPYLNDAPFDAE